MNLNERRPPVEMSPEEFKSIGHKLVDQIASFMASLPDRPVSPGKSPTELRSLLADFDLLDNGFQAEDLFEETAELLFENSTFNGHPRFMAYITSSPTPIGALADFLASIVNQNVGGWQLAPMASEIEGQTIRWMAELIGYPTNCGGLLSSGGNMANFLAFLAARKSKAGWDIRERGMGDPSAKHLVLYVSEDTHTWIQKAADLFGLGTDAIRWIQVDNDQRLDATALRRTIEEDRSKGVQPFLVVGTAGTTATGAVDPLVEIAAICNEYDLWFHVDGAYGAFAAALPEASEDLKAISMADSVALDPHKWLYSPLEAGCTLVRDPRTLLDAFTYRPDYYQLHQDLEAGIDYYEYGMQNSRGFRALKVWLGLRQAGRNGIIKMIQEDVELMRILYQLADEHPELQPYTHNLSITTFRYKPIDLTPGTAEVDSYINKLNSKILDQLAVNGKAYISNAVINQDYMLRACVVNFRTTLSDVQALSRIVVRIGREIDSTMRTKNLA